MIPLIFYIIYAIVAVYTIVSLEIGNTDIQIIQYKLVYFTSAFLLRVVIILQVLLRCFTNLAGDDDSVITIDI